MSNEELQKAIDDITNENSGSDDAAIAPATPAADAAAPAPAADADKKSEEPETILPPAPAPEVPPTPIPEDLMPAPESAAKAMPATDAAAAAAETQPIAAPAPAPEVPAPAAEVAADIAIEEDAIIKEPTVAQVAEKAAAAGASNVPNSEPAANLTRVKQDALRELFPLMDKLNVDPVQKFGLYKDIIATTHEQSAIEEAHEAIKGIEDEQTRADALLELLGIIAEHQ